MSHFMRPSVDLLRDHGCTLIDPNAPLATTRPPHEWSAAPEEWDVPAIPEIRLPDFNAGLR